MEAVARVLTVAGPVIQGIGGLAAGNQAKRAAYEAARDEEMATNADALRIRDEARRAIGDQLGAQWANGFTGDSGSALDAVRESQVNAALDAMERRRQGAARARSLREEGRAAKREGIFGLASGILSGVGSAIGQKADWAQANAGSTPS